MCEKILLWQHQAPDTDKCGSQEQPYMVAFPVKGVRQAVIVCPGGGYSMKCITYEGNDVCRMLNQEGIAAFRLDYRVYPCPCETPLKDVQRAVRLARSFGYDQVAVLGFSAGGHLACSAATLFDKTENPHEDDVDALSARPDALVSCYSVATFGRYTHQGSRKKLLGDEENRQELIYRFSPELNVDANTPPAFIWHTASDPAVPCQGSLLLAKALADAGVEFELHIYPRGPHGMGMAQDDPVVSAWVKDCVRFLKNHGFGK